MFNGSMIYDPDTQKYLDYYKELLKKSEQARFIRQFQKAQKNKPWTSQAMDGLRHLLVHLHFRKQAPLIPQSSSGHL